jgi:hypothetical protein
MPENFAGLLGNPKLADLPEDPMELPIPNRIPTGDAARSEISKTAEPIETAPAQRQKGPELAPSTNAPDRPAPPPEIPSLPASGGLPNTLLNQPTSLPRLADAPTTPEPESSLFSPTDSQPRPAASQAALPQPGLVKVERRPGGETGIGERASASAGVAAVLDRSRAGQSQADVTTNMPVDAALPQLAVARPGGAEPEVPGIYRLRMAPNRAEQVQQQGGTLATEAAVNAALNWLAANQSADGRWDASRHGAGREDKVLGHDRQGAGSRADTGVTGLALLAFLGAGHTHTEGAYQEVVARGLEFLIRSQARDGNLGGDAELYAFMYCHGMAAIALSEAYALTHDEPLELPLRRAVSYTLVAQNQASGGWRYRPGDRQGDTSQLGWQLMALKSAKLGGVLIPARAEEGMIRFLRSVAAGTHGGLASYRPNERPSVTMTAEALVCRNFLGLPADSDAALHEAGDLLLEELPGSGKPNLYLWYYATLAMHDLGGEYWRQWNSALCQELVSSQVAQGPQAGSWPLDDVWSGYGGRVYTTAMGALCLEVYYRFLPLYDKPR